MRFAIGVLAGATAALCVADAWPRAEEASGRQAGRSDGPRVVREFVRNASADDWHLDLGWFWEEGVLTRLPGAGTGVARQVAMPRLTAGRLYRLHVTFSGWRAGSVRALLGGAASHAYGRDGRFPIALEVTGPDSLLAFRPSDDFHGSLSDIRLVELGDELVDASGWDLGGSWTQRGTTFTYRGGPGRLSRPLALVPGRVYSVWLSITGLTRDYAGPESAYLILGGSAPARVGPGGWNYAYDIVAGADGGFVFAAQHPDGEPALGPGTLGEISVREIVTDPAGRR